MTGKAIREALEPFAKAADGLDHYRDNLSLEVFAYTLRRLTLGDLRRARTAYEALSPVAVEEGDAKAVAWRDMASAPKDATEIILRIPSQGWPDHYAQIGHWAQDLSGEEQPPFRGWFRKTGYGCAELADPTGWRPLFGDARPVEPGEVEARAQFLLERLESFANGLSDAADVNEYHGHVAPAVTRFRAAMDRARAALTGDAQEASPMEKLGKFGWHPDPVIDFEVEIEKLESRFDCAMRGTSKPGEQPETVQAVYDDILRAMTFKAGGTVEGVVAKNRLRELEKKALAAPAGDAHEAGR